MTAKMPQIKTRWISPMYMLCTNNLLWAGRSNLLNTLPMSINQRSSWIRFSMIVVKHDKCAKGVDLFKCTRLEIFHATTKIHLEEGLSDWKSACSSSIWLVFRSNWNYFLNWHESKLFWLWHCLQMFYVRHKNDHQRMQIRQTNW